MLISIFFLSVLNRPEEKSTCQELTTSHIPFANSNSMTTYSKFNPKGLGCLQIKHALVTSQSIISIKAIFLPLFYVNG